MIFVPNFLAFLNLLELDSVSLVIRYEVFEVTLVEIVPPSSIILSSMSFRDCERDQVTSKDNPFRLNLLLFEFEFLIET